MIPHCNLERGITQSILRLFLEYLYGLQKSPETQGKSDKSTQVGLATKKDFLRRKEVH